MNIEKEELEKLTDTGGQKYVIDQSFERVYANNVQFSMSVWDANLTFGEIVGEDQDGATVILQKIKVNMSKEMAKVLMFILEKNIGIYETKAGEISLPDIEIGEPKLTPRKGKKKT